MSKDPAFLFYAKDFYEGTRTMLPEERACYIDLLIYQHQNGIIPNDLRRLKMYCSGVDEATLKATLEAKFKQCDKGWCNEKLRKVQEERREFSEKQSQNGLIGQFFKKAKAQLKLSEYRKMVDFVKERYNNYELANLIKSHESHEATLQAMLKAMLKHLEDEDVNAIEDVNENKKGGAGGKIELPWDDSKFKTAWQTWKTYKDEEFKFKYKNSDSEQAALTELANKANGNMQIAIAIIRKSMANGWKGFFKLTENGKTISKNSTGASNGKSAIEILAERHGVQQPGS